MSKEENILLVEGSDDLYAIAELMGHYTDWPRDRKLNPVQIIDSGGVEKLLKKENISTRMKSASMKNIGVVVDADNDCQPRWDELKNLFKDYFPAIPEKLPSNGLICENNEGKRLGIWIMPDNSSQGMLETFLSTLIHTPESENHLWMHAIKSTNAAKQLNAIFRDAHLDKAKIHSWLAWQDPPGDAFGTAILRKVLNPSMPSAQIFAKWFMDLYKLPALNQ